jgi:uncharacterized protein (UPF0332 family)
MKRITNLLKLAEEDLETAQLLYDNQRYRACVSRSYYAMYYATQALLDLKGVNSRTHKGILQQFSYHFIKTQILPPELAKYLKAAFDLRQLSDYDETCGIDIQQCQIILQQAISFFSRARNIITLENRDDEERQ